jgi:ribulose-bisphosphate carboxylase large chain
MINITAETQTMLRRAECVIAQGGDYVMVDILTCGWSALQTLRDQNFKLVIHAHRAGHAAFTKNEKHGIAMKPIASVARIIGVDQLHVGTVVGKMSETKAEVLENIAACKAEMGGLNPVLPVASGGLHPRLVPALMETFGTTLSSKQAAASMGTPMGQSTAPKPCAKLSTQH